MHISEVQNTSNTFLTKCSKMTEEHQKIHGMNGNVDVNIKEECPKTNYVQGGRLKFFKDGKFILELERAQEGERVSWVSVPRKTFWPPQGTAASTPTYRQESITSLSVSDDNSSIQSSPWQRDHSWKQTNPRKNLSKEMSMYFWRPKHRRLPYRRSKKRRRPYSTVVDGDDRKSIPETTFRVKKEKPRKGHLLTIVQTLIDKNFRTSTPPRSDMVVSPRKRFLREMEKDRVQMEDNGQKRSRNKTQVTTSSTIGSSSPSTVVTTTAIKIEGSSIQANGMTNLVATTTPNSMDSVDSKPPQPPKNCSYSITSLLAEDNRNVKRSSPSISPSHFSPVGQTPPYVPPPPPTNDRWYSESVDRLRSIELTQVEKRGAFAPGLPPTMYHHSHHPPPPPHHHHHLPHPHHQQPYLPPTYIYQFHGPPYYGPGVYGRAGYGLPVSAAAAAGVYHSPMQLPAPPLPRHDAPPTSLWTGADVTSSSRSSGGERREEASVSDMPLNLSKHAG